MSSVLSWMFSNTILGTVVVSALLYGVFAGLRKFSPKVPNPTVIAGVAFIIGLLTIPSIPRYMFEDNVLSQIEGKPWVRVTQRMKFGDLTEPLTLILTPVGLVRVTMPSLASGFANEFQEIVFRYEQDPKSYLISTYCSESKVWYSTPDAQGVFRYLTSEPAAMSEAESQILCTYDWTLERKALYEEIARERAIQSE